jgi:hypothetical protein
VHLSGDVALHRCKPLVIEVIGSGKRKVPVLGWGKGKSRVRTAESNREVVNSQIAKEQMDFNQNIFLCVQNFNNQPGQLELAKEAECVGTTIETYGTSDPRAKGGFDALLVGSVYGNGNASNYGLVAYFWSSSSQNSRRAYRYLYYNSTGVHRDSPVRENLYSVRCKKNN